MHPSTQPRSSDRRSPLAHPTACPVLQVRAGLPPEQPLLVRMTGCPNGCARPYTAELGFVGDGPNRCDEPLHCCQGPGLQVHTVLPGCLF